MQTIAAKAATMISKSLMAFSQWPHAENASAMLLFPVLARRGAADRGQYRQAAGAIATVESLISIKFYSATSRVVKSLR